MKKYLALILLTGCATAPSNSKRVSPHFVHHYSFLLSAYQGMPHSRPTGLSTNWSGIHITSASLLTYNQLESQFQADIAKTK